MKLQLRVGDADLMATASLQAKDVDFIISGFQSLQDSSKSSTGKVGDRVVTDRNGRNVVMGKQYPMPCFANRSSHDVNSQ